MASKSLGASSKLTKQLKLYQHVSQFFFACFVADNNIISVSSTVTAQTSCYSIHIAKISVVTTSYSISVFKNQ